MKYLHTMVRIENIEKSLDFYCNKLGLKEIRRTEYDTGRFTLIFIGTENNNVEQPLIELTYNWDQEKYTVGRNFGHIAFSVKNIYEICNRLLNNGVIINRPPRDGRMAFVRSPDNISIELLQEGDPLPKKEPWVSMKNIGEW